MVGPVNNGAPGEANHRVKGCMWVSTEASRSLGRRPKGGQGQNRIGDIPPSGSAGGPAETWTMVELGPHRAYRKSECWKLSTYSCARRGSIPTSAVRYDTACERYSKEPHTNANSPGRYCGASSRSHALHCRDLCVQGTTAQELQRHHDRWRWRRISQWGAGHLGVCFHGCRNLLRLQGPQLVRLHRPRLAPPYRMGRHASPVWAAHCAFRPYLFLGMCHL